MANTLACVRTSGGHFNIPCDSQFIYSVLDELYVSHTTLDMQWVIF